MIKIGYVLNATKAVENVLVVNIINATYVTMGIYIIPIDASKNAKLNIKIVQFVGIFKINNAFRTWI